MQPVLCYVPLDWLIFWFPLLGFRVVSLHNHSLPWLFPNPTHVLSHAGWRLITVHFRWKLLLVISVPYTCFAPISKRKKVKKKGCGLQGRPDVYRAGQMLMCQSCTQSWGEEEGADCICVLTGWIPEKFHLQSAATLCWKVANIPEQWQNPQTCLLPVDLFITHTHTHLQQLHASKHTHTMCKDTEKLIHAHKLTTKLNLKAFLNKRAGKIKSERVWATWESWIMSVLRGTWGKQDLAGVGDY